MSEAGVTDIWGTIAREASEESQLWAQALRPEAERECEPVFSQLSSPRFALALETIYEGYLLHYGRPRLFAPGDEDTTVLLGDYLFAHGLVRLAGLGDVTAVADMAELISLSTQLRGEGAGPEMDGAAWAATAVVIGSDSDLLDGARGALRYDRDAAPLRSLAAGAAGEAAVAKALSAHADRVQ